MRLDRTQVKIRERNVLELVDLACRLLRVHFRPIVLLTLVGAAPWILINHFGTIWLIDDDYGLHNGFTIGVQWYQLLMVVIEAPLGTLLVTAYLGHAVFDQAPSPSRILSDVWKSCSQWLVSLFFLRGILFAIGLLALMPLTQNEGLAVLWSMAWFPVIPTVFLIRWIRPFAPEVIVLERPGWSSGNGERPSLGQRMSQIHARSSSQTMGRGLLFVLISFGLLWISFMGSASIWGLVSHEWLPMGFVLWGLWPASLWLVAAFMAVLRFVNYLDVRIRQEGWEIELLMRTEGRIIDDSLRIQHGLPPIDSPVQEIVV